MDEQVFLFKDVLAMQQESSDDSCLEMKPIPPSFVSMGEASKGMRMQTALTWFLVT